ncbi:hypothetical protein COT99_01045 [Candidatus Falkowbacteria bacterium CG10_big_fil_rev_8_21_14_0_10_43_10]|uniref:Membrane insertase YidC/Oxa/ALB C-terminal domain-containing protein n=1 Tax=Candidatus Falkowbacteria bacterium CG10_big_fil_rev_8_21_14_0_10_43_10 TaxID=1974567 RepID=A0A2H0V2S1_9BACT|nr:MAG: hypothetical protein COT99_01045 [Candidatus Falkowbacteria bacterium CG10_big_fil_rev_8_21_14_0_10_43_10]
MSSIFHTFFYEPIFNLLVFLYNIVPGNDIGIAIIILTALIRLALFPLNQQSIKSQKALQDLQPKIDELKKRYADNKQELGKAMMDLYKEQKVNPFSSCLPLLIQFPFLIAVFYVFRDGLTGGSLDIVYNFIQRPDSINAMSLGIIDLAKPNPILAVLAGLAQFWQAKMMMAKRVPKQARNNPVAKDEDMMAIMNKQMVYFMPAITVFIGLTFPGGLTLYWLVTTLLTGLQQVYIFKKSKIKEGEIEIVS